MVACITETSPGVITTSTMQILQFEWTGAGNPGDTLVLQDNNGRTVWEATAPGTDYDMFKSYARPIATFGLNLISITSGTLMIFYV